MIKSNRTVTRIINNEIIRNKPDIKEEKEVEPIKNISNVESNSKITIRLKFKGGLRLEVEIKKEMNYG